MTTESAPWNIKHRCRQCGTETVWVPIPDHPDGGLWCWDLTDAPPMPETAAAPHEPGYCIRCEPD